MTPRVKKVIYTYYNFAKLFSYNAWINIVCGGRGIGKSYGAKKKGIKDALAGRGTFIYLRRYPEELSDAKMTFFDDVMEEFPAYDFRVHGKRGQASKRLKQLPDEDDKAFEKRLNKREWITVCWFFALSAAQKMKSTSFPDVVLIIYDEFIIEKSSNSRYLKNEAEGLINFYSTIDRGQDRVRLLMLSNSVSIMNPFFTAWKIEPDRLEELTVHAEGAMVVHFPDSAEYRKKLYETRFGKFISEFMPGYADYAVGNEFADAHAALVAEKTSEAKYKYSVETSEGKFSVWYDMTSGVWFILSRIPGNERVITLNSADMDKGKIKVTTRHPVLQTLRGAFNRGKVEFDSPSTRNAFVPIFDRT